MTARIIVNSLRMRFVRGELLCDERKALLRTIFILAHVAFSKPHEAELVKKARPGSNPS